MRTWLRAVVTTPSATADMDEHLRELIDNYDKISKLPKDATTDDLHYQRGVVAGLKIVLFALENAKESKR